MKHYFFSISTFFPLLVSLLFRVGLAQDYYADPRYLVDVSDAYNHLEKKDYTMAGVLINEYLSFGSRYPDAHLIMGEVLINRKLYQQAQEYLAEAEEGRDYFILPETLIRLYWVQIKAFSHSQNMSQILLLENEDELEPRGDHDNIQNFFDKSRLETRIGKIQTALEKIIDYARLRRGDFYREQSRRAHFMLARVSLHSDSFKGIQNFLHSVKGGFLVRSSYLYIAYFFAIQNQGVIDRVYRNSPQGPPEKRRAFILYYQNYLNSDEDELLRQEMVSESEYEIMQYATKAYYKSLQR